jgi:hypothetical protein
MWPDGVEEVAITRPPGAACEAAVAGGGRSRSSRRRGRTLDQTYAEFTTPSRSRHATLTGDAHLCVVPQGMHLLPLVVLVWGVLVGTLGACVWLFLHAPPPGISRVHRTRH